MSIDMNAPATRQDIDDVLAEIRTMADGMHGALQQTRDELKGEIGEMRHDINIIHQDIDGMREDIESMHEEVRSLTHRVAGLESAVRELRMSVEMLEHEKQAVRNELSELHSDMAEVKEKVNRIDSLMPNEQLATSREVKRLEAWAKKLGEHVGVPFPLTVEA